MRIVNIYDAKTHLSKLIAEVLNGEEILIAKNGRPLIRLLPYEEAGLPKCKGGQLSGMLTIADDFDAPLPKDILNAFHGDHD